MRSVLSGCLRLEAKRIGRPERPAAQGRQTIRQANGQCLSFAEAGFAATRNDPAEEFALS